MKRLRQTEGQVRRRLAHKEGISQTDFELCCQSGRHDILTRTKLIEVKRARLWKHALGQVLAYHYDTPDKQNLSKVIHLFGPRRECQRAKRLAEGVCAHYGVALTTQFVKFADQSASQTRTAVAVASENNHGLSESAAAPAAVVAADLCAVDSGSAGSGGLSGSNKKATGVK